eukprot:Em0028g19a
MLTEEEIEEFRLEKSVTTAKSPEELQKLMVDENLNPIERACLLISTGQDVQRVCTIEHLPQLLESSEHKAAALSKVLPKLCTLLSGSMTSPQVLICASETFAKIVERGLVTNHVTTETILPIILSQLDNKDPSVGASWLDTLITTLPFLPKDVVERLVLPVALLKGQLSQSVTSRMTSCRLIGRMAKTFESRWLEKELLPLATTLCQDVLQDVRMCMCRQLEPLARALGRQEVTKTHILHEISELVQDEEWCVRGVAVETLVDLIPSLDKGTVQDKVVSLLMQACDHAHTQGDNSLPIVAKQLGRMCYELKDVLSPDQRLWFRNYYCKLSSYSAAEGGGGSSSTSLTTAAANGQRELDCRHHCAYNFPAMLLFAGQEAFQEHLAGIFKSFVEDEVSVVRRCVGCGFHEVVALMGDDCTLLLPYYQTLLRDSSFEVLSGLAPHLPQVMDRFAVASNLAPDTRHPGLLELIPALTACEQTASGCRQWRLHEELLNGFSCLSRCMTSDQLYTKFTPIMYKYISKSCVLPVKMAAGKTYCVFIRSIRKAEQRKELCTRLVEGMQEWVGFEKGYGMLQKYKLSPATIFIDICQYFLDVFSRSFFKEHFFLALLSLSEDQVVNIRLRLYRVLPSLKAILKLPADRLLLQQLEQVIRKCISQERDVDASQAIRDAVSQLDKIEVAMETLSRRTFLEADTIDQARAEEEAQLVQWEERQKEQLKPHSLSLKASPSIARSPLDKRAKSMKQVPSPVADRRSSSTSLPSSPGVPHRTLGIAKTKSSTTSPLPVRKTSSGCTMSVPSEEPDAATPTRKPQSSPASTLPTSSGGSQKSSEKKGSQVTSGQARTKPSGSPLTKPTASKKDLSSSPSSLLKETASRITRKT